MTTLALEIPLSPAPQRFEILIRGVFYQLVVHWCAPAVVWVLDIADVSGIPIVSGIPLVTGVDLLGQYEYLGIGGSLVAQTDNDANAVPTYENLGKQGHLYFVTT